LFPLFQTSDDAPYHATLIDAMLLWPLMYYATPY
jgi:hypothetical protein